MKDKEYRYYGVIVKSQTLVSIVELEDDSTMDDYSYFIYANGIPHEYFGIVGYEVSLFDVETNEELKNDYWEIESIKVINWNGDSATILLKDVFRNALRINKVGVKLPYGLNNIVSAILNVFNNYSCKLEYELMNDRSIEIVEKPVSVDEFIEIKNKIRDYMSKYRQLEQNTVLWNGVNATHKLELKKRYDDAIAVLLNMEIIIDSNKEE